MRIIDLIQEYVKFRDGISSQTEYEASFPDLFEHYNRFWIEHNRPYVRLSDDDLRERTSNIIDALPQIDEHFRMGGFNLDSLRAVLFAGRGSTNGHACELGGETTVWLPIEPYTSEMLAWIFVTHEIIHALHYIASPELRFSSREELHNFERMLITEGIATYLTAKVLNVPLVDALWADYLSTDDVSKWIEQCKASRRKLLAYCIDHIDNGKQAPAFFRADNPENIFEFRAGYFIGAEIAQAICDEDDLTPQELLGLDRKTIFEKMRRM